MGLVRNIGRKVKAAYSRGRKQLRLWLATEQYQGDVGEAYHLLEAFSPQPKGSAIVHKVFGEAIYDLTVIVPAYNAEAWIEVCMDSILSQETSYTFQVIAVDDGSTDSTGAILDGYASDPRVLVIHQENQGHSGARNTALKRMQSHFVMFVDADDFLLPDAIDVLMKTARRDDADIVEGNGYRFDENGRLGLVKPFSVNKEGKPSLWGGPCLKVMRSELFADVEFPMGYLYEDTIMEALLFPRAKKIATIDTEIYAYRIHSGSITQSRTAEPNRVHSFWIMLLMQRNREELGIPLSYESYCMTMRHIVFSYRRTELLPDEVKKWMFLCTGDFVMKHYAAYGTTKDEYLPLFRALQAYQYEKYCVFCERD